MQTRPFSPRPRPQKSVRTICRNGPSPAAAGFVALYESVPSRTLQYEATNGDSTAAYITGCTLAIQSGTLSHYQWRRISWDTSPRRRKRGYAPGHTMLWLRGLISHRPNNDKLSQWVDCQNQKIPADKCNVARAFRSWEPYFSYLDSQNSSQQIRIGREL